jgi:uncharacterized protein YcbX
MAHVAELWRYPVKSFQGERVDRADIGPDGIVGDRRYAVTDPVRGAALSAKTERRLLDAWARTVEGDVVLTLPTGEELAAVSPDVADRLSAWLGREVGFADASSGPSGYWMTLDPPNDDAEQYEIPMPERTFFDLYQVHVLTSASMARCHEARPDLQWDVRRFRPNVLVADDGDGYPEDEWVGGNLDVGGATLEIVMRTMRCAMPLRAQPALDGVAIERALDVYRALDATHANDLGVYCSVASPGEVAVGDAVSPR